MEPLWQKSEHPARPGTHLSWMRPQCHARDGGGGAFMQTQNLPFIMIISTIILICSFYLYFPQGLAVLFVSLCRFSWAGLSVRAGVVGAGSTKTSGVSSLECRHCGTMLSVNSLKHTKSIPCLPLEDLSWLSSALLTRLVKKLNLPSWQHSSPKQSEPLALISY